MATKNKLGKVEYLLTTDGKMIRVNVVKRLITLTTVIVVSLGLISSACTSGANVTSTVTSTQSQASTEPSFTYTTFVNSEYSYTVDYPSNWSFHEFPDTGGFAIRHWPVSDQPLEPWGALLSIDEDNIANVIAHDKLEFDAKGIIIIDEFETGFSYTSINDVSGQSFYARRYFWQSSDYCYSLTLLCDTIYYDYINSKLPQELQSILDSFSFI